MKIKSNIGWLIDRSPYKREYIRQKFNKSRNTISNWCTGKSYPSVPELFELAEMLNVKVGEMYEVIKEGREMDKTIYTIEDLEKMEEFEFIKNEGLLINGVSLFEIDKIEVVMVDHDLVTIRFLSNGVEIASIVVTEYDKLEVNNKNIFTLIN